MVPTKIELAICCTSAG